MFTFIDFIQYLVGVDVLECFVGSRMPHFRIFQQDIRSVDLPIMQSGSMKINPVAALFISTEVQILGPCMSGEVTDVRNGITTSATYLLKYMGPR